MTMKKEKIETPLVAIPRKGISQAIKFGNVLFVSGQVGEDVDGNVPEGIEKQTELAITNARRIIEAAGATPVAPIHDGRGDIITDGVTGYAFGPNRSAADALRLAISNPIPADTLLQAAARYSYRSVANAYSNLFSEMLAHFQL